MPPETVNYGPTLCCAIFLFHASNAGGESIIETALEFWKAGRNREEIQLKHLETDLTVSVFDNKNSTYELAQVFEKLTTRLFDWLTVPRSRWFVAHDLDQQGPGGFLRPVPAARVQARGPVRHGQDGGRRMEARSRCGQYGG